MKAGVQTLVFLSLDGFTPFDKLVVGFSHLLDCGSVAEPCGPSPTLARGMIQTLASRDAWLLRRHN